MDEISQLTILESDPRQMRHATMAHRVFEALKLAIVQLQLRPGHWLSEAEVAKQLGTSRQPVREAFIKLAEVGLVEVRPQRGTVVLMISRREVENARFMREALEVAVVRRACLTATDSDVSTLRSIVARQRLAAESGDHTHFLKLDEELHQAISQSAECEPAWRVVESLKAQMDRVRYLSITLATPLSVLIEQHQAIVEAIALRDFDAAEREMRLHLTEILKSLPRIAAARPDIFVD